MKHRMEPVPPPLWFSLLLGVAGFIWAGFAGWAFTATHLWWAGVAAVLAVALWAAAVYYFPARPREDQQQP